jgi:hypothetical protein
MYGKASSILGGKKSSKYSMNRLLLHEKSLVKNDVIFGYHLVAVPRLKNVLR